MPRSKHWKAGLFVIVGAVLIAVAVSLVAGIHLAAPRQRYFIRFDESVSGLEVGAAVKYRGVDIGNVTAVRIPKDDMTKVEVEISVAKEEVPIKVDTKATLSSLGITGLKFVELLAGSEAAPRLPSGSMITAQESLFSSLSGTAQTAAEKLDILLANLIYITDRQKVDKLTSQLDATLTSIRHSTGEASALIDNANNAAQKMDELVTRLNGMMVRNEVRIDSVFVSLDGALHALNRTLAEVEESDLIAHAALTATHSAELSADLRSILHAHRRTISETLVNLRETSANLSEFSRFVRDRPSLLLRSTPPESPMPGMD
jgi:phospholipid/cholesterol/gamma-HCH transport system substrate-binding protein